VNTKGLVDECPTEPIHVSESLRAAIAANQPPRAENRKHAETPPAEKPAEEPVLVGAGVGARGARRASGSPKARVRPSIREHRS
jgi:hypothetical protein